MFKAVCGESERRCEEFVKVGTLEFSSEYARASSWHIKCDGKSTEQTEPIKRSGHTAQSECEQHARKRHRVQKQTGGEKPHSMQPHKYPRHQD